MSNSYRTPTIQTTWNIDNERSKALHYYFVLCEDAFVNWDLEGIDVYLRSIKRIASGKLKKDIRWGDEKRLINGNKKNKEDNNTVVGMFRQLEKLKRKYLANPEDYMSKIQFYNKADEIYEFINSMLQEHGFWFREGLDPTKAALRR